MLCAQLALDTCDVDRCMMCRDFTSDSDMTAATIVQRIVRNRDKYEARNAKKNASEADYYSTKKQYMAEI